MGKLEEIHTWAGSIRDGRGLLAKYLKSIDKSFEDYSHEELIEMNNRLKKEKELKKNSLRLQSKPVEGLDHYPPNLRIKIKEDYYRSYEILEDLEAVSADPKKTVIGRHDNKIIYLPKEDTFYYMDVSRLYDENGKLQGWESMKPEKLEKDREKYDDRVRNIDPKFWDRELKVVLNCEQIGLFVFDSEEMQKFFDNCKLTKYGFIFWNVVLKEDGRIFIKFSSSSSFSKDVTDRINNLDMLRRFYKKVEFDLSRSLSAIHHENERYM